MSRPLIMSFRPDAAQMCLDGRKTETRRLRQIRLDLVSGSLQGDRIICTPRQDGTMRKSLLRQYIEDYTDPERKRVIWDTDETVAILPGRGKCAVGRVQLTDLHFEKLSDITDEGALREGMEPPTRDEYLRVWRKLYPKGEADPELIVISFRPVEVKK